MKAPFGPVLMGLGIITFIVLAFPSPARADEGKLKITVVAVLASSEHKEIDKRLKELAPRLKKKDPSWTGFEVERSSTESLKIGDKKTFPLVDDCDVTIVVKERDEAGCVSLLIKPPTLGEIAYTCCCDKYFPVITRYETKSKKRLVIAIMVQPCTKSKDK